MLNRAETWLYTAATILFVLLGVLAVYQYHKNELSKTHTALLLTLAVGGFFVYLQGVFTLLNLPQVADLVTAVVGLLVFLGGIGYTLYSYRLSGVAQNS